MEGRPEEEVRPGPPGQKGQKGERGGFGENGGNGLPGRKGRDGPKGIKGKSMCVSAIRKEISIVRTERNGNFHRSFY